MTNHVQKVTRTAAGKPSRRWRGALIWAQILALAALAVVVLRMPSVLADLRDALARADDAGARWPWAGAVVAGETLSLAGAVTVQRQLLAAGGARLGWRVLFALALATAGLTRLLPAGPATGGYWLAAEYRRRGLSSALALWAVVVGGGAAAVSILGLLLAGAAVAGVASLPLLAGAAAALVAISAGLVALARHAGSVNRWLDHRHPGARRIRRMASALTELRVGRRRGAAVLALGALGWLGDAGVLAACFGLAGLPVPWHALLFACAAGQVAGRLVGMPGGLGGLEAGLIGALVLTGTTPAAAAAVAILYRVLGYWAVGGAGSVVAAALPRLRQAPTATDDQAPVADQTGAPRTSLPAAPIRRPRAAAAGRPVRWWPQFLVVAAVLWALDFAVTLHSGVASAGIKNADVVASISSRLGGGATLTMNRWLAAHPLPATAAGAYYVIVHVLVTGIAGVLLLRARPPGFRLHRNALIAVGVIGLTVFWLYPVAPPRMLPPYHDIAAGSIPFFSTLLQTNAADQFAALPSLHMAWALWVAVASQALLRRRLWRAAVWGYPVLTALDVLATANHFMLDVVTAPAVLALAYGMAALAGRARFAPAAHARPVLARALALFSWAGPPLARLPRPKALVGAVEAVLPLSRTRHEMKVTMRRGLPVVRPVQLSGCARPGRPGAARLCRALTAACDDGQH